MTISKANKNASEIENLKGGLPELQRQVNDLQSQIDSIPTGIEGPPGPQGEPGPAGADGTNGVDGLSCWDLNGNHFCDVEEEDKDLNNVCDALDCQGPPGADGEPGADLEARSGVCDLYAMLGVQGPDYCQTGGNGGVCPNSCTGGCINGTCIISCIGGGDCVGGTIICPAGLNCNVICDGTGSCTSTTITCPDGYACTAECTSNVVDAPFLDCGTSSECVNNCTTVN